MISKSEPTVRAVRSQDVLARRMEIKYVVDRSTRTALARDLRAFMAPDRHAGADGGYVIRSLYLDTADYMAYHEKLAGGAVRHKLRVRAYGENPQASAYVRLEVKSRILSFIHKITVDVPTENYGDLERAIRRETLPPAWLLDDPEVSAEFFRLQRQYNMVPQILLQYRREAFERNEAGRLRVNFDDDLLATRHLDLLGPLRGARSLLRYGHAVFEVKVDGAMPYWMHMLIGKYNLQNESFSKYCYGIRSEARFSASAREEQLV